MLKEQRLGRQRTVRCSDLMGRFPKRGCAGGLACTPSTFRFLQTRQTRHMSVSWNGLFWASMEGCRERRGTFQGLGWYFCFLFDIWSQDKGSYSETAHWSVFSVDGFKCHGWVT